MINDHHIYQWYCPKKKRREKRKKMFSDDVISKTGGGEWENAGGHQRALLASLAEISLEGYFLNNVSAIQNSQICSCWPSLYVIHTTKSHWSEMFQWTRSDKILYNLLRFNDNPITGTSLENAWLFFFYFRTVIKGASAIWTKCSHNERIKNSFKGGVAAVCLDVIYVLIAKSVWHSHIVNIIRNSSIVICFMSDCTLRNTAFCQSPFSLKVVRKWISIPTNVTQEAVQQTNQLFYNKKIISMLHWLLIRGMVSPSFSLSSLYVCSCTTTLFL